ncbi:MAG TPA: hypothetical protein VNN17_02955 [Terriglobia bacterium]|nr:hypothetical protein [Terriglobia bacterium]
MLAALAVAAMISAGEPPRPQERAPEFPVRLGTQRPAEKNKRTVALEFHPPTGKPVRRLRVAIEVAPGPWRFERAQPSSDATLQIHTEKKEEERVSGAGEKHFVTVLSLSIAAKQGAIAAGVVGQLEFTLAPPGSSQQIPLLLREWELSSGESPPPPAPAALEPPAGEPAANPAVGCFVFAH